MLDALDFLRRGAGASGLRAPIAKSRVCEGLLPPDSPHPSSSRTSAGTTFAKLLLALLATLQKYGAGRLLSVRARPGGAAVSLLLDDDASLGELEQRLAALIASRDHGYARHQ